jgi:hypothetical protein
VLGSYGNLLPALHGNCQVYTARTRRGYVATIQSHQCPKPRMVLSGSFAHG